MVGIRYYRIRDTAMLPVWFAGGLYPHCPLLHRITACSAHPLPASPDHLTFMLWLERQQCSSGKVHPRLRGMHEARPRMSDHPLRISVKSMRPSGRSGKVTITSLPIGIGFFRARRVFVYLSLVIIQPVVGA
jgi:hypothetical protein